METMKILLAVFSASLGLLGLFACVSRSSPTQSTQGPKEVTLFYTANRQGEIDPCGCQLQQLGGVDRMQTLVNKVRQNGPPAVLVDAGDTFFSTPTLLPTRRDQEMRRAKLISEAYRAMKVDVFAPGERDFAGGVSFLRELQKTSGVVFLSTNLVDEKGARLFQASHVIERGGMKIGFFSLADAEALAPVKEVRVLDPEAAFRKTISELRHAGADVVVLVSHLGFSRDKELAAQGGVDLIVGSHSLDALTEPAVVGKTWIVQPLNQGQQIGFLTLTPGGMKDPELVNLDKNFESPNEVKKLIANYRNEVRDVAVDSASSVGAVMTATEAKPYVAHPYSCRSCHTKQYDFWATTKHSAAYLVLFSKNQHFDPECISCHSVGFEQPGGFDKIAQPLVLTNPPKKADQKKPFIEELMKKVFGPETKKGPLDSRIQPQRFEKLHQRYDKEIRALEEAGKIQRLFIGVQCEHCHGNRAGHPSPTVATLKKVNVENCRSCHAPPNAPDFDPKSIGKVACPLSSKD
jgi:Cytochrome c554 and c-prime